MKKNLRLPQVKLQVQAKILTVIVLFVLTPFLIQSLCHAVISPSAQAVALLCTRKGNLVQFVVEILPL